MYTIPTNFGQSAFAHEHPDHEKCWDSGGINLPYNVLDFFEMVLNLILWALVISLFLLSFFFPPALTGAANVKQSMPIFSIVFFGLKTISIGAGIPMTIYNCPPMLVPPPVTVAGTVNLDCNDEDGFAFQDITTVHSDDPFPSGVTSDPDTVGYYTSTINSESEFRVLPLIYVLSSFGAAFFLILGFVLSIVVDFIFLLVDLKDTKSKDATKKSLVGTKKTVGDFATKAWDWVKGIFKKSDEAVEKVAKNKGVLATIKDGFSFVIKKLKDSFENFDKSKFLKKSKEIAQKGAEKSKPLVGSGVNAGLDFTENAEGSPFNWQKNANNALPNDAWTIHPFAEITDAGVRSEKTAFKLGKNQIEYFSQAKKEDTATFPFNVYDSEPPEIIFSPKNVTLEANAHYGFKVTSKSLPLIKLGSKAVDKCDPSPSLDYIGPDFYLLTKLKADQYAPWKTTDKAPDDGYNALTGNDIDRVLDAEIMEIKEESYQPIRVAAIDPSQTVEFSNLGTEFSTARHLFSIVTNAQINELIANNTKKVLPTADPTLGSNLTDQITLDEIGILGMSKLDVETLEDVTNEKDPLKLDNISPEVIKTLREISREPVFREEDTGLKFVSFDIWGDLFELVFPSSITGRPNIITDTEAANPNVFVDYQIVTVVDTIAPNILVTEDIAIEVNATDSTLTEHPALHSDGCFGSGNNVICTLEIRPPATFDIADPFPEIYQNITDNSPISKFEKLESPNLVALFPLGVSYVGWKSVDFSGNGNQTKDIVIQIVNIKKEGENIVSDVFPVNATVFSTVPEQITLIANNTDQDPLKFMITQDPEKGILDTPIDAVFLTKFQLSGAVSKLTGITNEINSTSNEPIPGVFFTDYLNQRVLFQNQNNDLEVSFELPQTTRPEGISLTGDGTFMVGDWKDDKILEVNASGNTIEEFDISGLFAASDIINKKMISVDQTNRDIYVTDSLNGTITKLVDFDIFENSLLQGVEYDSSDSSVFIADKQANLVHHFSSAGIYVNSLASAFSEPTDVTIDSTENIYVLDTGNNKIQKFDSTYDKVLEFGPQGNGLDFFNTPKGITFNGEEILVADTNNHQIKKILSTEPPFIEDYSNSTGDWVGVGDQILVDEFGSAEVTFESVSSVDSFNHVSRDPGTDFLGNFWSAQFDLDIENPQPDDSAPVFLWVLTNNTEHPQNSDPQDALGVIYENQSLKIFERHNNSTSISTTIDGLVKNKDYFITIEKLDSDLATMAVYQDKNPEPLLIGSLSHNISSEISNLQVLQHANNSTSVKDTPKLTITQTVFNPVVTWLGMCTSGPNCDTGSNTSNEFSCTDTSCFGAGPGNQTGQFTNPTGVSANSTHIFVTDEHRVQIFSSSGNHSNTLGSTTAGSGDSDFDMPIDIEVDSDGRIIVSDSGNNRIKIYDNSGTLDKIIEDTGFGSFTSPSGVGADLSGNIYVSDTGNSQLVKLDSDGEFEDLWKSSIDTRFDGYSQIYELYVPGIHAGALDITDENVFIGDWRNGQESIIVSNSNGGKIDKIDISSLVIDPHSIAINIADEIFITDTPSQKILVLDSQGNQDRILDVNGTGGFELFPTGITTASDIGFSIGSSSVNFSGEKLYVYDNSTEGIYAISENGSEVELAFSAKHLFSNLNDIAVNATHVFGLNAGEDKSKIIKVRWDKGIQETFDILGDDVTGITIGKDMDSDLIFYTTNDGTESGLYKLNTTSNSPPVKLVDLDSLPDPVAASGVATNPVISQLVRITIPDDVSNNLIGPRGLAFGSDNKMYVSSFGTDEIKVFNATTFEIIENISSENLIDPTDIIIGPNGTLFIASSGNHKILEYNQTSNQIETFVEGADGIVSPSGLAISPDNLHLFVSNGYDNTIKKIKLVTTNSTQEVKNGTETIASFEYSDIREARGVVSDFVNAENISTLQNPQYSAFGPDGMLYVSSFNSNEILKWDQNGKFDGVVVNATTSNDLLDGPTGIEFSPNGEFMFVSSAKTNKVLKFYSTGEFIGVFSDEQTFAPDGLSFGPNGNLFVSSVGSSEVLEYGDSLVRFYVSDWSTPPKPRVISFDAQGNQIDSIEVEVGLNNPGNIISDSEARLWIADTGNQRLVKLNVVANEQIFPEISTDNIVEVDAPDLTQTEPSTWVDSEGTVYDEFISDVITSVTPKGISVDNKDNLYISDWINHRIVALDQNGNFLGQILLNSTFTEPLDIAINQTTPDKLDDVWVYDGNFEGNQGLLVSLDLEKQFEVLEFTDELSPLLRGLTTNDTSLVTTPLNSGSLLEIDKSNSAKFDSRHFIIPLGIDLVNSGPPNIKEIYVTDWKESRIVKLDELGNFDQEFNLKGTGFVTPEQGDIEVNSEDEFFWITEPRRATLNQVFFNGTASSFPSVGDKYVFISGVDADKQDNFYIISNQNNTINKYDIRGALLADARDEGFVLSPSQTMVDISLGPVPNSSESLFVVVAEPLNNKVLKLNATTLEILDSKQIDIHPTSIAISNDGSVYVSGASLTISKLDSDLNKIGTLTIPSISEGSIDDMMIDSKNNLYAADQTQDRVYKYNLTDNSFIGWLGKCTNSTINSCDIDSQHSKGFVCTDLTCSNNDSKSFGRDVSQFFQPTSLTIDGLNNVYVADVKLSRDNSALDDPMIEFPVVDGTCPGGTVQFSETTCREIFNQGNVPRVQKFTQNGYFVDKVISDTNQTLVKGNFEWVNGIAYGTNNFYVADVEKLHVFDVNPFINLFTNTTTNETTAQVTYESFTDLIGNTDKDTFMYKVFDGFADSNVALVNITINTPDPDSDGIFGNIDQLPNTPSLDFSATDGTNGHIVSKGNQTLTIREDRDVEKGVYTQAHILGGEGDAIIHYCDDLAEVKLKPGNRLIATCTMGGENKDEVLGVEMEVLRGKIDVTFFDREGRSSTSKILLENTIHFSPDPFEFVTPKNNLDIINQTVHHNGIDYSYFVPKDSKVRIDTASPILPKDNCGIPLTLEADTIFGVDFSGQIFPEQTEKLQVLLDWLNFTSTEVDNGSTPETEGDQILVTSNVTSIENRKFPHNGGMIPTSTAVEFFTVDKVGNNATCTNFINIRDTTAPVLDDLPDIMIVTGKFSEVGNAFFAIPKIRDLPSKFNEEKLEVDLDAKCTPISGSEFRIGNTTVICSGYDLASNQNSTSFTVVISPNPEGLAIKNVKASGKTSGLKNGDAVLVEFTIPTNQPPVATTTNLDTLFELTDGTLGSDASGKFIDPSNLLITINNATSSDLVPGETFFDLRLTNDYKLLQSASGVLNSTGHYKSINQTFISTPILLTGDFATPLAPYITSFVVNDPSFDGTLNDDEYSEGDEFTIRFSEPTSAPGKGDVLTKEEVDDLFDFSPYSLGEDYVGTWKNPSTFIITLTDMLLGDVSKQPTLGSTQAQVIGNIKNTARTSLVSNSVSPPLSGTFGEFNSIREVDEERTLVQDLPSGIKLGISFPIINYTTTTTINGTDFVINHNKTGVFLQKSSVDSLDVISVSEQLDVTVSNPSEDCALGCEISFYIQSSDLPQGISLNELFIFHDQNNDGFLDDDELLIPKIDRLDNKWYKISVTVTSFSSVSLVAQNSGGDGGDDTPPTVEGASLGGGGSIVYLGDIQFENNVEKSIITVGEEYKLKVTLYENSGPDALQHISLYTDLRGFEREVHHSDAYIRYDKGVGVSSYDPQNLFQDTDIFILKNGPNLEIEFTIIFNKPMEESDLIVRAWDVNRNSLDTRFVKAIEVIPADQLEIPLEVDENLINPEYEITIDRETFEKWSGFSKESISDSELLAKMGLDGNSIPEWYKKIVIPWIQDGIISFEEFANSIKFFKARGLLG